MPLLFWPALVLLVANDHLLKGSGLLPSLVTGKLSDFAGLVVAPLVLCALFGVRSERARFACVALIALPFAAVKLSPAFAASASELLSAVLLRSRIWCDPTDLIALAVLPWTLRLARSVQSLRFAAWPQRIAIGAAALACTATSSGDYSEPYELRPPFLINWTHAPIHASITTRSANCADAASLDAAEPVVQEVTIEPAHMAAIGWAFEGAADAGAVLCGYADVRVRDAARSIVWHEGFSSLPREHRAFGSVKDEGGYTNVEIEDDSQWAFDLAITVAGSTSAPQLLLGDLLHEQEP